MAGYIRLFDATNGPRTVTIEARTNSSSPIEVEAVIISVKDSDVLVGQGEFKVEPTDLPDIVLNDDRTALKSWSEIQGDIAEKRSALDTLLRAAAKHAELDAARAALKLREEARDDLRAALAGLSVNVGAGAGAYVGIDGLPLGMAASTTATIAIDLTLLDPTLDPPPPADAVVLKASIAATGAIAFPVNRAAAMRVDILVTRAATVQTLTSLRMNSLPGFPALDFEWPRIDFHSFSWPALDLGEVSKLLRLDLPLPRPMAGTPPLKFDPALTLKFDVQDRVLTLATAAPYTGYLVTNPGGARLAHVDGLRISLSNSHTEIAGTIERIDVSETPIPAARIDKPELLPFTIDIEPSTLSVSTSGMIDLATATANLSLVATLRLRRVLVRAKSDPSLLLAVAATYEQRFDALAGTTTGKLTSLEVVEPYPVELIALAAEGVANVAQDLVRLVGAIPVPHVDQPAAGLIDVLQRIADMAAAAVAWVARQAGAAVDALLGLAEAGLEAVGRALQYLYRKLRDLDTSVKAHLLIEIRLDAKTYALRQIIVSPAWAMPPADASFKTEVAGFDLSLPIGWRPALVVDVEGPVEVALVALSATTTAGLAIGTDLWLSRDVATEAARDTDDQGKRTSNRLLQLSAMLTTARGISVVRLRQGKVTFFEKLIAPVIDVSESSLAIKLIGARPSFEAISWEQVIAELKVDQSAGTRLLPFLQSSKGTSNDFLGSLGQYIRVDPSGNVARNDGHSTINFPFAVTLCVAKTEVEFDLALEVNLIDLGISLSGGDKITIQGNKDDRRFDFLGLSGVIVPKEGEIPPSYPFFQLDFSSGDVRLALHEKARLDLTYGRVASSGRGMMFRVSDFVLSRAGIDLDAKIDTDTPVQLAGVDMPFRFRQGGLSIKRSEIQAFSIEGSGQLPPELVGEAEATISISMGRGGDGSLIVQGAEAKLDKTNDPIVCHATRFTLTITALGFEFRDFANQGAGYHFFFTLTGTAVFAPRPGEFTDGLLKHLGNITITLDKAPLARDATMLLKAIDFQVTVEPKKRFNFFNLFTFELRGIGFHPASPAFGGKPAMSISGQVNFVEAGDIVSPRFDFHKLWLAPPKDGGSLPQVRFDGLTVGVRFGGAASIEGTAIAVDDTLPSLYAPGALPKDVTARGFLASGKLTIKGWGAMGAAMGFLELQKPGGEVRHAFFLYGDKRELSIEIPTPLGPIYLREVGFGFGYRFTLAAFNRADQVTNVKDLIKVLDDISKYQGDLASLRAWEPEAAGNRLTLALRGLISIESASDEDEYNAKGEKDLPNPVLFDIVAALRSDLTFFLSSRVWIARNYADWHDSSPNDSWRTNPILRGYTYLSVPRREFLSRLISDGTGDVEGKHPPLPAPLMQAMKNIRWSATTYIRPGLFHQEFGWPYELGFTFKQGNSDNAVLQIDCRGGLINRIEDGSILWGIAFKAVGHAHFSGEVGGRSFGASAAARADFTIDAKFIAYVSVKRPGDTLFYGSLAFDLSIGLEVRIWLEFSVGFTDVHLEAGFSVSLTISLALEVAVWLGNVAGRGSASVAVGAFGRHLRLGVGFAFNASDLDRARAQVQRFLQLGLTVATPDAEQGVAPPAPERPRGPRADDADQAVDEGLKKHEEVTNPPGQAAHAMGRALQPTGYWAMLFPITGDKGDYDYVMIFVPRDHSKTGLDETVLPTANNGTPLGTFYAPPYGPAGMEATPLKIVPNGLTTVVGHLKLQGNVASVESLPLLDVTLEYGVNTNVIRGESESLTLKQVMRQCFVVIDARDDTIGSLKEPWAKSIHTDPERLPDTREAAAQLLIEAGRDQLALGVEERAANDIEERRSAVITALCESAARLAQGGTAAWETPPVENLDVRLLGVAFVVKQAAVDELFWPSVGENPRAARFELAAADGTAIPPLQQDRRTVHLFNPPERMFRRRAPRLADLVVEAAPGGIRLDWDLEPAFVRSQGVWHDPEFNLKHYRIERTITRPGSVDSLVAPVRVTTKSAAPIRLWRDPQANGALVWRFVRPNAQFIDDLADLKAPTRAVLLPQAGVKAAPSGTSLLADDDEVMQALKDGPVELRYTVVPVDIAGTDGPPTPLSLQMGRSLSVRTAVSRAALHFEYPEEPRDVLEPTPVRPVAMLGLDDGLDGSADRHPLSAERFYTLRIRREPGVPTGLYGSDAVTEAQARPSPADFAVRLVTDEDFVVRIAAGRLNPKLDEPEALLGAPGYFTLDRPEDDFLKAIGVKVDDRPAKGPFGVRFALQPRAGNGELPAPWCPIDITLTIKRNTAAPGLQPQLRPAVAVPVEIFEHPIAVDAAPLLSDDLDGDAGRLMILHPAKDSVVTDLLDPQATPAVRLRDEARRVATRLRWNSRPASEKIRWYEAGASDDPRSARRHALFFGGFDIFELDAAGEVEGVTSAPTTVGLRYKFSTALDDAAPGNGLLRLNSADEAPTAVFIDTTDGTNVDQARSLDRIDASADMPKGQLYIVKEQNQRVRMCFDVVMLVRKAGYRKLVVKLRSRSREAFKNNDRLMVLFMRDVRAVAHVQALPTTLAQLDPSEIEDFAKVEAHYPSTTKRLVDGARQLGAWYSPGESFVAWPERIPRRSLSINVDEPILTELLSKGRPKWVRVDLAIPTRESLGEIKVSRFDDGGAGQPTDGFEARDKWTAGELRDLLRQLVWNNTADTVRPAFESESGPFRNARITVSAKDETRRVLAAVEWQVDLDPGLHPMLADVIDWARYTRTPVGQTDYRRFEPVLEPQPKTNAGDVAGWFDDTPAGRDPYGWSVLRTLGLAAGLKLYDTERRDYLPPREALAQLNDAFEAIIPRYPEFLGAPFADLITHAGGTMSLASFDGGTPGVTARQVQELVDNALALTQISLRPVVDRFRPGLARPVAYFDIRSAGRATIDVTNYLVAERVPFVLDVIDLTSGLGKAPMFTLTSRTTDSDTIVRRKDLLDGAGERYKLEIQARHAMPDDVIAIVRVTVSTGDAAQLFGPGGGGQVGWVDARVSEIAAPLTATVEAFGRFPEMTTRRFGALASRNGQPIRSEIDRLQHYARRRWPEGWPAKPEDQATLIARIPEWTRRFIDYGAESAPATPRRMRFALAEVTRPDPWRIGVGADGTMEVLFTHDDRLRRLKRYAIRPFGRYDTFVDALKRASEPDAVPRPASFAGAWIVPTTVPADLQANLDESWSRRFFDAVLPRTEPLAPPVLIDAKRIEILPPDRNAPARRMLEFLYARHPEEILPEANVTVEGALSFETVAVGLWREFPAEPWARDLVPDIRTDAEFGDWTPQTALPLATSDDRFGGLAEVRSPGDDSRMIAGRYPEGGRGIVAVRTQSLPFFFRTHAAAFASAGVVVSSPVIATVEEGHYRICLPWNDEVFGKKTIKPRWSLERRSANDIRVTFKLPLVRYVDGMLEDSRTLWLRAGAIPEAFTLPDPIARYEIRAVGDDGAGLSTASAELDVMAEQRTPGGPIASRYRVNITGPLFKTVPPPPEDQPPAGAPLPHTDDQKWWSVDASARFEQATAPSAPEFHPAIRADAAGPLGRFELQASDVAAGTLWSSIRPTTTVTVTIVPADVANGPAWTQFKVDVGIWRNAYHSYAASAAAAEIESFLQSWIATDGVHHVPPTQLTVHDFAAGLPRLADGRPAAVGVSQSADWSSWRMPPDVGIDARQIVRTLAPSAIGTGYDTAGFAADITKPLCVEMRRIMAVRKQIDAWFGSCPLFNAVFPSPDLAEAMLTVAMALDRDGHPVMPESVDVVLAIPLTLDDSPATASKVLALIRAVEAARFTAISIVDLGAFEDGNLAFDMHVPCRALANAAIAAALADLSAPARNKWRILSLLLRMPPDDAERRQVMSAIDALVSDTLRGRLSDVVDRAMTTQVFGVGRTPQVKVYRGIAEPREDAIERASWP